MEKVRLMRLASAVLAVLLVGAVGGCSSDAEDHAAVTVTSASSTPTPPRETSLPSSAATAVSSSPAARSSASAPGPSIPTSSARTASPTSATAIATLLSDIVGRNDAIPRGAPVDWGYRNGAVPATPGEFTKYAAINVWGWVFAVEGSNRYDVRVQIRDPQAFFLLPTGWARARIPSGSAGAVEGAYWRGDFKPSEHTMASARSEGVGVYSVSMQGLTQPSRDAFHYWWQGMMPRIPIPTKAQGILVFAQMRLVPEHSGGSLAGAHYIAGVNGDLYPTPTLVVDPSGINPPLATSRMKYLTSQWQTFYSSTMTPDQLRHHPPPL